MLAAIPADCVAGVVRANFYGRERFMPPTALNAVSSLAVLGVGLIYLHAGASLIEMGIIEATIAWARAAAGLDMHRRLIGPLLPARPAAAYAAITRPAFPFFLTFVLTTVHTRSAVVIVRWLCGQEQLGLYGVAASAIGAAVATMLPLGTSLFPSVAQQTALTNGLYPRRALFTLLPPMAAGIAGAAGITLSAGFLVRTFLDVSFAESVFPLRLLSWMLPSAFISSMAMRMLLASGRATTAIRILALNCAVNIAANLTFVPLIGINGAALAGVVSASAGALQSVLALARGRRPGARCLDLGS
jgi:O-antigen/teichoic acid export membrane protein